MSKDRNQPPQPWATRAGDSSSDSDPEAVGLPPGLALPERRLYRRNQLWALMVSNFVALVVLGVLWWFTRANTQVLGFCALAVAVLFLINAVRWWKARFQAPST